MKLGEDEVQNELIPLQQESTIPPVGANESLKLHWEHQLPAGCHRASPVCAGDHLLLSLQDMAYSGCNGIRCLDAQTGKCQWHTATDAAVRNSVAVAPFSHSATQDKCAAVSTTGHVVVMEVTSGHILWQADLPGHPERWIYTSPVIVDDTVYVGAKAGYAAYDLETGDQQWYTKIEGNDAWSCYASPQIYDDLLIALVQRRGIIALNRKDGTIAWEQELAVEYQYPSPVVFGDLLVSGGDAKSLAVLQAQSGEIVWHEAVLSARYVSGLTVHGKRIYVTAPDGEAQCYDVDSGQLNWQFRTGEDLLDMTPYRRGIRSILAAPVIFQDHLLIGGCDGVLYVLDAESGECQSRTLLGSPITAAPCVVEDGFYVGTYEGKVCRFGL
ncbi:PQQ-binding-like beta-propeller repeat protein [Candidatus Poribacteria bacterium]